MAFDHKLFDLRKYEFCDSTDKREKNRQKDSMTDSAKRKILADAMVFELHNFLYFFYL